ncbi:MAG TPA: hypothetical protein VFT87_04040 [Candidatus Saccharimonadales bacterium]|nr:hypothetical protein [Candidatus Saccharimonadales bacterium]
MENNVTLNEIIKFLNEQPGSRPKNIAQRLNVSRQYVQRLLAENSERFMVTGSGPNRFYRNATLAASEKVERPMAEDMSTKDTRTIDENFYSLTPLGEELIGKKGLIDWSLARNFDPAAKQKEYLSVLQKYYPPRFKSPMNVTEKVKSALGDIAVEKFWAVDYYNFEIFGKTKLGTQVLVAKQTGDAQIIQQLIQKLELAAEYIIDKYNIEAIAFVSPTLQRPSQLMTKLDNGIAKQVPRIKVHKVGAKILIAQKTLKSLEDRILNAAQTFVVESQVQYNNVLIIDDALGSGATINEIARQIKQKKIGRNCYGLVLVSSPSGYDVINEV